MTTPHHARALARTTTVAVTAIIAIIASITGTGLVKPSMARADAGTFCTSVGAVRIAGTDDCLVSFLSTGSTTWTAPVGITDIEYLVVGGGGSGQGGNNSTSGKGGDGGQVLSGNITIASNATLTITVGAGGADDGTGPTSGGTSSLAGGGITTVSAAGGLKGMGSDGASGPSSSITGTSVVYGSDGATWSKSGGPGAGTTAGANAPANRGGGGGAGDREYSYGTWWYFIGAKGGSGVVYLRFAAAVAPGVLASQAPTGAREVGATLTSASTYHGVPAPAMTYEWQTSTDGGTTWETVPGADASTFQPPAQLAGSFVRVVTTASNNSGTAQDASPALGPLGVPATLAPSLSATSDTGASNSDKITRDAHPTIELSGLIPGAAVEVSATNGTLTNTCTFTATGSRGSCAIALPEDGSWTFTSTQDINGVVSASSPGTTIQLSTALPTPSSPSMSTAGGSVIQATVTATNTSASFSAPLEIGELVGGSARFWLNGTLIGTDSTIGAGDSSATLTFSSSADIQSALSSSGLLTVEFVDAAGNSLTGPGLEVTVDLSVPTVLITPGPGQPANTATESQLFTVTASEPVSGISGSDFANAGTATGCVFALDGSSGTEFTVTVTGCSAGTVVPQLLAGSISDGVNSGPSATTAATSGVNVVTSAPTGTGAPTLTASTGTLTTLGSQLVSGTGTWNDEGDSSPTTSFQWQVCDDSTPTSCTNIPGAVTNTLSPDGSLINKYLRSVVTRTNVAGMATQASALTGPLARSPQTITFAGLASRSYTPTPFSVIATATSGLAVQLTAHDANVCEVSGFVVTMKSAGTCDLTASQPGDGRFDAASSITQSFSISLASETPTLVLDRALAEPGTTFTLDVLSESTGPVTYSATGACTVTGNAVTTSGTGTCVLSANVAGDSRYASSSTSSVTIPVRFVEEVTFAGIPDQYHLTTPITPIATAVSGRTVGITAGPPGVCAIVSGDVVLNGPGTCTLTASLPDDGTWSSDTQTVTFDVVAPPLPAFINHVRTSAADGVLGGSATVEFTAGAMNGSLLEGFEIIASPQGGGMTVTGLCQSSPCTITGLSNATYDFTVTTRATSLGMPTASTSGTSVAVVLEFHPITVPNPGLQIVRDDTVALVATSGADPTWVPSLTSTTPSVCTVSGSALRLISTGTCEITAEHSGGLVGTTTYGRGAHSITFLVVAPSPTSIITPPSAPQGISWSATPNSVTISWKPANTNGFPVSTYQVRASDGRVCLTSSLSCTFSAGTKGTTMSFTIRALTGSGWGPWSESVRTVIPSQDDSTEVPPDPSTPTDPTVPTEPGNGGSSGGTARPMTPPRSPTVDIVPGTKPGRSTVHIDLSRTDARRPIEKVVIVVKDARGVVIRRATIDTSGMDYPILTRKVAVPEGGSISVYTINSAGVSANAPVGANVINAPTVGGRHPDGRPILPGKKIARPVFFGPNSPTLDQQAREILDGVARYVGTNGGTVLISGFVRKGPGSAAVREQLSSARAEQVATYLSSLGVKTWIHYDGAGAYRESATRETDRRVEIRWVR